MLELSALSHGTAQAHAPHCASPSRTFPTNTSVNHLAGCDKVLRSFVKAFLSFYQPNSWFYCLCCKSTGCSPACILLLIGKWSMRASHHSRAEAATTHGKAQQNSEQLPCHQQDPTQTADHPQPPTLLLGHTVNKMIPSWGPLSLTIMSAALAQQEEKERKTVKITSKETVLTWRMSQSCGRGEPLGTTLQL